MLPFFSQLQLVSGTLPMQLVYFSLFFMIQKKEQINLTHFHRIVDDLFLRRHFETKTIY